MEAYSMDLRIRIVESYLAHEGSQAELAKRFKVSERWLQNLLRQYRETSSLEPRPHGGGRQRGVGPEQERRLREKLADTPDATLDELRDHCGVKGSRMCIARALQRLAITRKKRPCFARNSKTPRYKNNDGLGSGRSRTSPGRFQFLDQTNAKTTLTRVFGRAPRGQRVREYVPDGRWESLTLMGSLGYWGDTTALTYEGGTDVPTVVTYVETVLRPVLDRDHIVVVDRLSSHLNPQVGKAVRRTGAKLWYLPPYSHDLNPIEQMWSKVKGHLRKVKPREVDALIAAIGDALRTITAEDAQAWFSHCGYD
jgi:transposase